MAFVYLEAELKRAKISRNELAKRLGISKNTLSRRMNKKTSFTLEEINIIKKEIFQDKHSYDYLFKEV